MLRYIILVFLSGALTMTLELVAGRLVAPVLGVSLYTWTSVIGVVLAGMSVGSFVGGWMADFWNPRRLLGPVMIISGLVTSLIVPALPALGMTLPAIKSPLLRVVIPIAVLFGTPSFLIGLISPIVYRICLNDTYRTGITVGRLAASGSLGSIVGTFATGFWLIPRFGTRAIVLGVSAGLVLLGLLSCSWRSRRAFVVSVLVLATTVGLAARFGSRFLKRADTIESAYYSIRITMEDGPDGRKLKKLVLDHLVHSAADPENPDYLWYEYERVSAWVIQNLKKPDLRALFIGGGGYTLPHWVERHYPDAHIEVVEIDPEVTRIALKEFVPDSRRIISHNEDGRTALRNMPESSKYDLIFGDAFNDVSVPYHLTTVEFARAIKHRLVDGGVYMANVIDKPGGKFLSAFANTLSRVFEHVTILPGSDAVNYGGRSPHIVIASMTKLPVESWPAPRDVGFALTPQAPDGKGLVLTDDFAPVDYLLLSIFAERLTH